jgi:hypothetical protein
MVGADGQFSGLTAVRWRAASPPALGKAIGGAYGGDMTRTDGTSDADAELRDVIRSIDAIGEGASGHEDPKEAAERTRAEQSDEE